MLPMRHSSFGRHRFACPLKLRGGRWWLDGPNKSCLPALTICLGLAAFSSVSFAQEQSIPGGLSSGLDLRTQAPFYIWRSYKGVNAYRDALDAANIKIAMLPTKSWAALRFLTQERKRWWSLPSF